MNKENKILFILKRRHDYDGNIHSHDGLSTGLYNSATYISDMLNNHDIESHVVVVTDNNEIDKWVTFYKPSHVIIEALWVVPEKFEILHKIHKHVKWIIRLHSQLPFLSNEGIAMDWIAKYIIQPHVYVAVNATEAYDEIQYYAKLNHHRLEEKIIYLPNYYPPDFKTKKYNPKHEINIACFGAIRPMKNHLVQAITAIRFADFLGKKLKFHINVGRIEKGDSVLKNIEALFENIPHCKYELVKHIWTPREDFIELCSKMDIGLQNSFSETFNIVSADLISQGVPVIGSSEIPWLTDMFIPGKITYSRSIFKKLLLTHYTPQLNVKLNQNNLKDYSKKSEVIWVKKFK